MHVMLTHTRTRHRSSRIAWVWRSGLVRQLRRSFKAASANDGAKGASIICKHETGHATQSDIRLSAAVVATRAAAAATGPAAVVAAASHGKTPLRKAQSGDVPGFMSSHETWRLHKQSGPQVLLEYFHSQKLLASQAVGNLLGPRP